MKRKAFKQAVATAMGRSKTKKGHASKKKEKGKAFRAGKARDSAQSQQFTRLQSQKKRLIRLFEKVPDADISGQVKLHAEAISVYDPAAREGVEFAEEERLWHLRRIYEDAKDLPEAEAWCPKLIVALLAASEVDEARKVLSETTSKATEVVYSRALLAFVDSKVEMGSIQEEGAPSPLAQAIAINPYVADILATLDTFTATATPQQLEGARCGVGLEGYAGSVEEALVYIADASLMWVDREGMEDWVTAGVAEFGQPSSATNPRSCVSKSKYKNLFVESVAEAKNMAKEMEEQEQEDDEGDADDGDMDDEGDEDDAE
eukprot:m.101358 g.101358  ORF g.101358 m.101358 type:complete len:318 (+) comp27326_c1_seq2:1794-2747(+)